eukprot:6183522-Pleurochrysis_carterae.AAC.2
MTSEVFFYHHAGDKPLSTSRRHMRTSIDHFTGMLLQSQHGSSGRLQKQAAVAFLPPKSTKVVEAVRLPAAVKRVDGSAVKALEVCVPALIVLLVGRDVGEQIPRPVSPERALRSTTARGQDECAIDLLWKFTKYVNGHGQ